MSTSYHSACRTAGFSRAGVLFSGASLLAALWGAPALAQPVTGAGTDAAATLPPAQATAGQIEDIVVTARRVSESLQSTPIAVTAVTAQSLESRSVKSIADLAQFTPSLISNAGAAGGSNNAQFFIRGVGQTDYLPTTDGAVGVYIDGVFLARATGNLFDLADVEQIEILRGPQGTLFGKNTNGGAISVSTRRPGFDTRGRVELTVGSRNRFDVKGLVEGGLVDGVLAGSLAFVNRKQDGYGPSLAGGEDLGDTNMQAIRGALNFQPTDKLSFYVTADYTRRREHMNPVHIEHIWRSNILDLYNSLVLAPQGTAYDSRWYTKPLDTWSGRETNNNLDSGGISGIGTWEASDNVTLKSITAWRKQKVQTQVDNDGSPIPLIDYDRRFTHEQFSQELQLNGTAVDGRLKYVGGLFYMHENVVIPVKQIQFGGLYAAMVAARLPNPQDLETLSSAHQITDSYAAFVNANFEISSSLGVSGGIRYSKDKKHLDEFAYFINARRSLFRLASDPTRNLPIDYVIEADRSWDGLTATAGIHYQASRNAYFYGSFAQGFKSGGFDARPVSNLSAPTGYDPEKVTSYEVGAKLNLFDRHVRWNTALFLNDYKDMQVSAIAQIPNFVVSVTTNAGSSQIKGAESELLVRLDSGLGFDASVSYTDAQFKKLGVGIPFTLNDQLISTPKWAFSLGAQYKLDLGSSGSLLGRVDYNYKSKFFLEIPNTYAEAANGRIVPNGPFDFPTVQPAYGILNARLTYETENKLWTLAAFTTNLTNERFKTFGLSSASLGISIAYYGPPREFGLSLSRRF